ncbi:MAG: MBL fold metallo-hydrolase, partial [Terriglobia bacterium]
MVCPGLASAAALRSAARRAPDLPAEQHSAARKARHKPVGRLWARAEKAQAWNRALTPASAESALLALDAHYRLEPCEVDVELAEGDSIAVGDLSFQVFDTPGHCDGHVSLLVEHGDQRLLFAGDVIFFGGKILLQNLYDCRLDAHIQSLRKLRELDVTALLSGHLTLSLQGGQRHIERANEVLDVLEGSGQKNA